jgi:hypothetical protein
MFNWSTITALSLGLLSSSITAAQDAAPVKVNVGDSIVNGRTLRPYKNQWAMTMIKPDGTIIQDAGSWKDELAIVMVDGEPCLQRTQLASFKKATGEIVATTKNINVFEQKTFAPISRLYEKHVLGHEDYSLKIKFGANTMKVEFLEDGKTEVREVPTTVAFDFYGGIYAVLWATLPLKEGFSATYPSYAEDEHPEKVSWVTMRVTGSETIDAGTEGKTKAWVVESDTEIGALKYWVSKEPPYIIRMNFRQPNGTTWLLKMS